MSLFEAAVVTSLGMFTAYQIPIPEIKPFVTVILILLWVAAASALFLLPAIFCNTGKIWNRRGWWSIKNVEATRSW